MNTYSIYITVEHFVEVFVKADSIKEAERAAEAFSDNELNHFMPGFIESSLDISVSHRWEEPYNPPPVAPFIEAVDGGSDYREVRK